MKAFVTGSRAYGTPREDSDIDLVVLVSPGDMDLLREATGDGGEGDPDYGPGSAFLRFGKLNLLCVSDPEDYDVWHKGTDELKARRPVTRDVAVETFKRLRGELDDARMVAEGDWLAGLAEQVEF